MPCLAAAPASACSKGPSSGSATEDGRLSSGRLAAIEHSGNSTSRAPAAAACSVRASMRRRLASFSGPAVNCASAILIGLSCHPGGSAMAVQPPTIPRPAGLAALPAAYGPLFDRAVSVLGGDERVRAIWLAGALGRGAADAASDLDFVIAVRDE